MCLLHVYFNYAFVFATFSRAFPLKVFRRIFAMHCLHFQSLLYSYMPSEGYFKFRLISVIYHVFPGIILFVRCRGNPPPPSCWGWGGGCWKTLFKKYIVATKLFDLNLNERICLRPTIPLKHTGYCWIKRFCHPSQGPNKITKK